MGRGADEHRHDRYGDRREIRSRHRSLTVCDDLTDRTQQFGTFVLVMVCERPRDEREKGERRDENDPAPPAQAFRPAGGAANGKPATHLRKWCPPFFRGEYNSGSAPCRRDARMVRSANTANLRAVAASAYGNRTGPTRWTPTEFAREVIHAVRGTGVAGRDSDSLRASAVTPAPRSSTDRDRRRCASRPRSCARRRRGVGSRRNACRSSRRR